MRNQSTLRSLSKFFGFCLLFIALLSCSNSAPNATLSDSSWVVEQIRGNDSMIILSVEESPTLTILSDSTFSAQTLCNVMGGTYTANDNSKISFSIETITAAFCPDDEFESIYIEQLSASHLFAIKNGMLFLNDSEGRELIIFSPRK